MKYSRLFFNTILTLGFFLFIVPALAANVDMVINEIAAYEKSGCEWLELYNKGAEAVNLEGWKFWENSTNHGIKISSSSVQTDWIVESGEYVIIAEDDEKLFTSTCGSYVAPTGTVFDSSWTTLNESGEEIGLKDVLGNFMEKFAYVPITHFSLQRKDSSLLDYSAVNWQEHVSGNSFGKVNDFIVIAPTPNQLPVALIVASTSLAFGDTLTLDGSTSFDPDGMIASYDWQIAGASIGNSPSITYLPLSTGTIHITLVVTDNESAANSTGIDVQVQDIFIPVAPTTTTPGKIFINEFVSDPNTDQREWIELYNAGGAGVNLIGYTLSDGVGLIASPTSTIPAGGFLVIEISTKLNNGGDIIVLKNAGSVVVDRVAYGDWDDSDKNDNVSASSKGNAIARKIDGSDTGNNKNDFIETTSVTPGLPNTITEVFVPITVHIGGGGYGSSVYSGTTNAIVHPIIINEIFPNPIDSDRMDEFIELKNIGNSSIDLTGWKITSGSKTEYVLPNVWLESNHIFFVKRSLSGVVLRNAAEEVKLYEDDGSLENTIKYSVDARSGFSYARRPDGIYKWTNKPTPGVENSIVGGNEPPVITLDAERDGAVGVPVKFDASDSIDPDGDTIKFSWKFGDGLEGVGAAIQHVYTKSGAYHVDIFLSDGDTTSTKRVVIQVKGGLIQNEVSSANSTFELLKQVRLSEFFPSPETASQEFIELYNPTAEIINLAGLALDDAEGGSQAYSILDNTIIQPNGYFLFKKSDTKLALNNTNDSVRLLLLSGLIIDQVQYDKAPTAQSFSRNKNGNWQWTNNRTPGQENSISLAVISTGTTLSRSAVRGVKIAYGAPMSMDVIQSADAGDVVRVTGVVTVMPGIFGSQYFYIADVSSTEYGVQVYSSKKNFPKFSLGSLVTVVGEVSVTGNEKRIKIKKISDIQVHGLVNFTPAVLSISDLDDAMVGGLVAVNGEVTQLRSANMYIDDGGDEIMVAFKKNIGVVDRNLKERDRAVVVGIVKKAKDELEIVPRSAGDIGKIGGENILTALANQNIQYSTMEKYLAATSSALGVLLLGLLLKMRGAALVLFVKTVFAKVKIKK